MADDPAPNASTEAPKPPDVDESKESDRKLKVSTSAGEKSKESTMTASSGSAIMDVAATLAQGLTTTTTTTTTPTPTTATNNTAANQEASSKNDTAAVTAATAVTVAAAASVPTVAAATVATAPATAAVPGLTPVATIPQQQQPFFPNNGMHPYPGAAGPYMYGGGPYRPPFGPYGPPGTIPYMYPPVTMADPAPRASTEAPKPPDADESKESDRKLEASASADEKPKESTLKASSGHASSDVIDRTTNTTTTTPAPTTAANNSAANQEANRTNDTATVTNGMSPYPGKAGPYMYGGGPYRPPYGPYGPPGTMPYMYPPFYPPPPPLPLRNPTAPPDARGHFQSGKQRPRPTQTQPDSKKRKNAATSNAASKVVVTTVRAAAAAPAKKLQAAKQSKEGGDDGNDDDDNGNEASSQKPHRSAEEKMKLRIAKFTGREQIAHRRDVPADVKDFVIYLRFEARSQKKKLELQIKRLKTTLQLEKDAHRKLKDKLDEAGYSLNKAGDLVLKPGVVSVTAVPGEALLPGELFRPAEFKTTLATNNDEPKRQVSVAAKAASAPTVITITEEPLKKRAVLGPAWTWETAIDALKHFQKGNGHLRVPTRSHLGRWVMEIRSNYKFTQEYPHFLDEPAHGSCLLDHARVKLLNEMGFEWCLAPPKIPWQTRCDDLEAFCILHGHSRVPRIGDYAGLGEWVKIQRRYYKEKNPILKQERIDRLAKIPHFVWSSEKGYKYTFEERLEECRDFRRQHGHLCVHPLKTNKNLSAKERSFRDWARYMRCAHNKFKAGLKSRLDGIKIKKLDEMGFVWHIKRGPNQKPGDPDDDDDGDDDEEDNDDDDENDTETENEGANVVI